MFVGLCGFCFVLFCFVLRRVRFSTAVGGVTAASSTGGCRGVGASWFVLFLIQVFWLIRDDTCASRSVCRNGFIFSMSWDLTSSIL